MLTCYFQLSLSLSVSHTWILGAGMLQSQGPGAAVPARSLRLEQGKQRSRFGNGVCLPFLKYVPGGFFIFQVFFSLTLPLISSLSFVLLGLHVSFLCLFPLVLFKCKIFFPLFLFSTFL